MVHNYESNLISKTASGGQSVNAVIVGARGYSGLELARILLRHPKVKLTACLAGEQSFSLSDYLPEENAKSVKVCSWQEWEKAGAEADVVFLATPAETSLEMAQKIRSLKKNISIIDISGAFRLSAKETQEHYGFALPSWAEEAVYGLSPFVKSYSKAPALISNPGCFATSILMALVPLLKHNLIQPESLVIDSKSGSSGAGKKAQERLLFTEVSGECLPYRIGKHQHLPEIERYAAHFSSQKISPHFTTHLLPTKRGIISGLYAKVQPGVDVLKITQAFEKEFEGYSLVKFGTAENLLRLNQVCGSARTHMHYQVVGEKLYLFSLIDNLLKGAASQAVENLNILQGWKVEEGLSHLEGTL